MSWAEICGAGLGAGILAGVGILCCTLPAQLANRISQSVRD